MLKPTGSWVAMPTPFDSQNKVDFGAFKVLIDRQIQYSTSELFILGSAGEVTLLSLEEKKTIVHEVIKMTKGRIPVFFSCAALSTPDSVAMAQYCESEGADGVIFTVPPYVLIPQNSVFTHLDTCMSATKLPCGIYNNPSRLGVQVMPETIKKLSDAHENFVVDKEAMGSVEQLVQVKRLCGDKVNIMCCHPGRGGHRYRQHRRQHHPGGGRQVLPPLDQRADYGGVPRRVLQVVPPPQGALPPLQPHRHQGGPQHPGAPRRQPPQAL